MDKNKIIKEMEKLIEILNTETKAYDLGTPRMSDEAWDNIYFSLEAMEKESGIILPNSPTQIINYTVVNELKKVKHNHPMLSLAKTKDIIEVEKFIGNNIYIAMCKMDGLTCSLKYLDGKLISAETRGDGEVGEDITHNAMVISSIPKKIPYKEELIIDGEIICTYEDFKEFSNSYKNPRNFASGSIRLLDSKLCERRNLTFVAWDVIKGIDKYNLFLDKLSFLKDYGFKTVPCSFGKSIKEEIEDIKFLAERNSYPIDGVVFKFNDINYGKTLGRTDHHFNNAIAYKFYDETYEAQLKYIDWTMGRTGVLTPVAVFEPIEIDGTIVERASLHNVSIMREIMGDCCYLGQPLEIFKANQIIPQVKNAKKLDYGTVIAKGGVSVDGFSGDILCPICGGGTAIERSESGTENLICLNENCEGKIINKLDHFCSKKGLDIKGLSKATLEKLVNWGWISNIYDIYELNIHKQEWINKQGFGEKSVEKILKAIEESKNTTLANFISALGIPLVGKTVAKELVKYIIDYPDFRDKIIDNYDFTKIDGFGEKIDKALKDFDYTIADKLYWKYMNIDIVELIEEEKNSSLEGLTFVITGKMQTYKNRDELKAAIEAHGGKVVGSISGKTDYLINNDINSTSAKNKKAKELNIPIITEEELNIKFFDK